MIFTHLAEHLLRVTVAQADVDLDAYFDDLAYLEARNVLTFGDTNFRILERFFLEKGYPLQYLDLCFDDDKSIGLEMPKTFYLNKGKHALSIAAYYNYLNFHGIVEQKNLDTFNMEVAHDYGRLAAMEVYLQDELEPILHHHGIRYFGTPRTLTECIRYLEGWSLDAYPRLKGYATFSRFIEQWSRTNFPDFNASEWYLGKEVSARLNTTGLTNVRKAVRYFWKRHLLESGRGIAPEDVELDLIDGERFRSVCQPKVVLLSEDLFSDEKSDHEIFANLTKRMGKEKIYFSKSKNMFPKKNMEALRSLYPNTLIVCVENEDSFQRNFTLMTPIKQSLNRDVVLATKVLRKVLEQGPVT